MQIIFAELDNIAKAGPSEGDLNKMKEFMLKKHAEDLKENSYWLGSIDEYLFTGMNPIKGLRTDCQQHHREGHPEVHRRLVQAEERD